MNLTFKIILQKMILMAHYKPLLSRNSSQLLFRSSFQNINGILFSYSELTLPLLLGNLKNLLDFTCERFFTKLHTNKKMNVGKCKK